MTHAIDEPSAFRTRLTAAMIDRFTTTGAWSGVTIGTRLRTLAAERPDQRLVVDGDVSLGAADVLERAERLAAGLIGLGLAPGDVVSFQLPNWHEAILVDLACALGGFVCNPVVPIYRERETGFILKDSRSKVLFVPERFRGFDYRAMIDHIAGECPDLVRVVYVRTDAREFERLTQGAPGPAQDAPEPNHVKLLLYTSGTTGTPKGVLHTHNTIDCEVRHFAAHLGLGRDDVVLMPSTLAHITGYLYGIQLPVTLGVPVILMEAWDAAQAADLIDRHGVTFTIGATPFLQELVQLAETQGRPLPTLRLFPSGGAPVPPTLVYAADRAFERCKAFRVFGSTEAPTVTLGALGDDAARLRAETDGLVVGHEVRLVRADGSAAVPGEEGEILTRGPEVCVGYAWELNEAFDAKGYFWTGDLGRFDEHGCLTITGRAKDLIIRGGENISPKEIEDILYRHPAVQEAAVVAMPHPRLGETACAYVAVHPGMVFDFEAMRALLAESGAAKQKFPERLVIWNDLPKTPSGKIRKNVLRDDAQKIDQ